MPFNKKNNRIKNVLKLQFLWEYLEKNSRNENKKSWLDDGRTLDAYAYTLVLPCAAKSCLAVFSGVGDLDDKPLCCMQA